MSQSQELGESSHCPPQVQEPPSGPRRPHRRATGLNLKNYEARSQLVPSVSHIEQLANENMPWNSKNVLSFDGGGIRGLYSLYILHYLMKWVRLEEEKWTDGHGIIARATSSFQPLATPEHVSHIQFEGNADVNGRRKGPCMYLPCHYFDYIAGTSTGGLIATMLGRFRMTVDDCIREYETLGGEVFGHPRLFHQASLPTFWTGRAKYKEEKIERTLKKVIGRRHERRDESSSEPAFKTGDGMTRAFVFAFKIDLDAPQDDQVAEQTPYIFRSYPHYHVHSPGFPRHGSQPTFPIWKVGRATTAASVFFPPFTIDLGGHHNVRFVDGGIGTTNNPSWEALHEVRSQNEEIGTFVSIGTGRKPGDRRQVATIDVVRSMAELAGDTEFNHEQMSLESRRAGFGYYRFNEVGALDSTKMDEWDPAKSGRRTRRRIRNAFLSQLDNPEVMEKFRDCARELVRRRRLRTFDQATWERFALGTAYQCPRGGCRGGHERLWHDRGGLLKHLEDEHGIDEEIEENERLELLETANSQGWRYRGPTSAR